MKKFCSIWLLMFISFLVGGNGFSATKCVQIYYDYAPQATQRFWHGRIHAMMLQNLLGHFKNVEQRLIPIENYQSGDIERCASSIYVGTFFENRVPQAFFDDFEKTTKRVAWLGYNVWRFGNETLNKMWGVNYLSLTTLDRSKFDEKGHPGFFKFYSYKGEEFFKFGKYENPDDKNSRFHAAFEISNLKLVSNDASNNVLSWARHSISNEKIPYILAKNNKWYVGDSPFSYTTEDDRYLIFSDLLFDILDEKPIYTGKKPAVFRMEDVHARNYKWQLTEMLDMLQRVKIPFSMTMIPIFVDPFGYYSNLTENNFVPMDWDYDFMALVARANRMGATFIYHGVTHQYGHMKNPFSGVTGSDFEFWNAVKNIPIAEDSPKFVVKRLEDGLPILENSNAAPSLWLTPHYQASALDYVLFGQLFTWNAGRVIYFPSKIKNPTPLPVELAIDRIGSKGNGKRLQYLQNVEVEYPKELMPNGQFFPYEIFTDTYGQRVIPENIGNIQQFVNEQVPQTRTVEEMIKTLKRNRVLRDVWGSFFVHPFLIDSPENSGIGDYTGDTRKVEQLIKAAIAEGYEFVSLKDFVKKNQNVPKIKMTEEALRR